MISVLQKNLKKNPGIIYSFYDKCMNVSGEPECLPEDIMICVWACEGQSLTLGVFLYDFLHWFIDWLIQELSLSPELTVSASLSSKLQVCTYLCLSSLGYSHMPRCSAFIFSRVLESWAKIFMVM